jgi:hypothetical protein
MTTPAPKKAIAPYAQACGVINADGSIDRAKGIKSVTLGKNVGRFCIELEDSRLDVTEITPVATLTLGGYPGFIYIEKGLSTEGECGNKKNTITVITANEKGGGEYKQFFILVP